MVVWILENSLGKNHLPVVSRFHRPHGLCLLKALAEHLSHVQVHTTVSFSVGIERGELVPVSAGIALTENFSNLGEPINLILTLFCNIHQQTRGTSHAREHASCPLDHTVMGDLLTQLP